MAASMAANTGGSQTYDGGAVPDTLTVFVGAEGSLVVTVTVADLLPSDVGWNRMGTTRLSPGATVNGKFSTCAIWNSADDDEIALMVSVHAPLLLIVSGRSLNFAGLTHSSPKLPVSAITVAAVPDPTVAFAATTSDGKLGSLLAMVRFVLLGPGDVGLNPT